MNPAFVGWSCEKVEDRYRAAGGDEHPDQELRASEARFQLRTPDDFLDMQNLAGVSAVTQMEGYERSDASMLSTCARHCVCATPVATK
jgi:hypothetical protein